MKFIINETGETKTLKIRDINGIDWTRDLIGNSGAIGDTITYDEDSEAYRINQADYDWWAEYIDMYERYEADYQALRDEYGGEAVENIKAEYVKTFDLFGFDYTSHDKEASEFIEYAREQLSNV